MRKWTEIIRPYPQLRREQPYRIRVVDIRKNIENKVMEVTFEFLESNQDGRRITVHLSLPIRPHGLTSDYFRSCHIEVKPQTKISPRDTIGSEIVACFEEAASCDWQPIHFEPIKQGEPHEPIQAESHIHSPSL